MRGLPEAILPLFRRLGCVAEPPVHCGEQLLIDRLQVLVEEHGEVVLEPLVPAGPAEGGGQLGVCWLRC